MTRRTPRHPIESLGMTKTPKPAAPMEPDPRFAPVAAAFADDPDVTAGRMMASYGLKVNGKIFAMVVRGRLALKLPRARVDALVSAGQGEQLDTGNGRRMKEWISTDVEPDQWLALAQEAYRFVKAGAS